MQPILLGMSTGGILCQSSANHPFCTSPLQPYVEGPFILWYDIIRYSTRDWLKSISQVFITNIACERAAMEQQKKDLSDALAGAEKILIGIGGEWKLRDDGRDVRQRRLGDDAQSELREAYGTLAGLVKDKDYYVVTTVTDGAVYDSGLDEKRIVAPCGNIHWRQCSKACTRDIWEDGEVPDDVCPHCKASLTGNTIDAGTYIEEGYMPRWEAYMKWQAGTLNRRLVILELGEGFKTPTVIRWPFEKIAFFNQKAVFYRIHQSLFQLPGELEDRAAGIQTDSLAFIRSLRSNGRFDIQ